MSRGLLVTDLSDRDSLRNLSSVLQDSCSIQSSGKFHPVALASQLRADVVLVELARCVDRMEDGLRWLRRPNRRCKVLLLGGRKHRSQLLAAMEAGAEYVLEEPFDPGQAAVLIRRLLPHREAPKELRAADLDQRRYLELPSPAMVSVRNNLKELSASARLNVLLMGETGVGKWHAAKLLHDLSPRANLPFIEVDCASLPGTLVEAELFGYEPGAFTDARGRKAGMLEMVKGGTLFLDEIGELSMESQAKLLKAVEQKSFRRLGGLKTLAWEGSLVSASNRSLLEETRAGRFRSDLFYRINAVKVMLPPLRERPEDIEPLANFFIEDACKSQGRKPLRLDRASIERLKRRPWPGNIRELKNLVEAAVALSPDDGGPGLSRIIARWDDEAPEPEELKPSSRFLTRREREAEMVIEALQRSGGNKAKAARFLGISKPTFYRMLKQNKFKT